MDDQPQIEPTPRAERLGGLHREQGSRKDGGNRYTKFIKSLRVILPFFALVILAIVVSWNMLAPDEFAPAVEEEKSLAARSGKNELVDPKFESIDEKNQPYVITASRALQDMGDELMILEEPVADIVLESGNWLAIKSRQGAYTQDSRKLLLKDNVQMFHDDGYTVFTDELNVDMNAGLANTNTTIRGHGPIGTLDASGMDASTDAQILKFIGPAKIVLYDAGSGEGLFTP